MSQWAKAVSFPPTAKARGLPPQGRIGEHGLKEPAVSAGAAACEGETHRLWQSGPDCRRRRLPCDRSPPWRRAPHAPMKCGLFHTSRRPRHRSARGLPSDRSRRPCSKDRNRRPRTLGLYCSGTGGGGRREPAAASVSSICRLRAGPLRPCYIVPTNSFTRIRSPAS
jgi:hypothetical protein